MKGVDAPEVFEQQDLEEKLLDVDCFTLVSRLFFFVFIFLLSRRDVPTHPHS